MVESKLELPDLPPLMDQAILDPLLTQEELITACDAGRQENVRAICTTLRLLEPLRERLGKTGGPRLVAVVGFPFGSLPGELKQMEAEWAAARGAEELDMVPDFTALINQDSGAFAEEIAGVCELGLPVRVVLDMARLNEDLITLAVDAAIDAGAAGLQTSNGFGPATSTTQVKQLLGPRSRPLCRESRWRNSHARAGDRPCGSRRLPAGYKQRSPAASGVKTARRLSGRTTPGGPRPEGGPTGRTRPIADPAQR